MEKILKIDSIEKYYGSKSSLTKAIDNISFDVERGEFIAIMGASGSGKTTLLNCISTIDKVTSGHIYLNDLDVTTLKGNKLSKFRREELGFIFQDFNLLDTLTAYDNIALALSIQNKSVKNLDELIKEEKKYNRDYSKLKKQIFLESIRIRKKIIGSDKSIVDEFSKVLRFHKSPMEFFTKGE